MKNIDITILISDISTWEADLRTVRAAIQSVAKVLKRADDGHTGSAKYLAEIDNILGDTINTMIAWGQQLNVKESDVPDANLTMIDSDDDIDNIGLEGDR